MLTHASSDNATPERIVIIGSGGFVGASILRKAARLGAPVVGLTRQEADLAADGAADRLAAHLRPGDSVVAVAAVAPVKTPSMLLTNIVIAEAIAGALRAKPPAHLLNIGSDAVYADSDAPLTEASSAEPASLHGVMHLAREVLLREAAGDAPFASLRPTLIYGARDPHDGYGPNRFRRLALDGAPIRLFGEGEERRDHVHVEDVAELAVRTLARRSAGVLNAATGTVLSFREIAELTVAACGSDAPIETTPRGGPMPHNGYRPFDASETARAFPDFDYTPPADGIVQVVDDVQAGVW